MPPMIGGLNVYFSTGKEMPDECSFLLCDMPNTKKPIRITEELVDLVHEETCYDKDVIRKILESGVKFVED